MTSWKYTGKNRRNILGRWYFPGMIVSSKNRPSVDFVLAKKEEQQVSIKEEEVVVPVVEVSEESESLKEELSRMKMQELRIIGKKYDVYDTKKSELVDEIMSAKKMRGEI